MHDMLMKVSHAPLSTTAQDQKKKKKSFLQI